jgi:hypothetical protein
VVFLSKEEEEILPFKHVRKDKTERSFKGTVIKATPDYKLVKPDRTFFIQMVKFAPGKGPQDYIDSYKALDEELKAKYGTDRCGMDCHEIASFLTFGEEDMIVLWDAPDLETYQKVVLASISPARSYENKHDVVIAAHIHA